MGLWKKVKKAWKKAKEFVNSVKNALTDISGFLGGLFEWLFSFLDFLPKKKLRMRIFVLFDGYEPVKVKPEIEKWLAETKRIFKDKMNIRIKKLGSKYITFISEAAPEYALTPSGDSSFIYSSASRYFQDIMDQNMSGLWSLVSDLTGYGQTIEVFVVKTIAGGQMRGFSVPFLYNYCLLAAETKVRPGMLSGAHPTDLAHEIGHMCWLRHHGDSNNLMNETGSGSKLKKWQKAKIRNSKYVTYL